jgi:hypothetical protein
MSEVIPALYTPEKFDMLFHASMSCTKATITHDRTLKKLRKDAHTYRVTTHVRAFNIGKSPCPSCWVLNGFDALSDPIAMLG